MAHFLQVSTFHLMCVLLGHGVQRATVLEPLNLALVESVRKLNVKGLAVLRVHSKGHWLADG